MGPKNAKTGASTRASAASKASPATKKTTPVKKATAVVSKKKAAPTKKVAATAKKKATATAPKKAAASPAKRAATVAPKKASAAAPAKKGAASKKKATTAPAKKAAAASAKKAAAAPAKKAAAAPAKKAAAAPAKKAAAALPKKAAAALPKKAAAAPAKKAAENGKNTARATKTAKQGPVTGKRGLSGQAAPDPTNGRVGTVDPAANLSAEAMLAEEERDLELDAMLTQIDVSQNMDKYFILQVICEPPQPTTKRAKAGRGGGQKANTATDKFYFFTRWGRTGTSGSCKLEGPFDELEEASKLFGAKFKEKTGNIWDGDDQEDRYLVNAGKYTCLRRNATRVVATPWQYWVDDGVDGKEDGWYDYEDGAAAVVEQLHTEFQTNPSLNQRVVVSGVWTYHVDLSSMIQTNVSLPGRKVRHIRRNPGRSLPNTPPGLSNSKAKNGKNKISTASAGPVAATQQTAEVDKHCPKAGNKNVSVCPGHDVKLNQTNISANNNKFYILQMCHDSGRNEWFVWTRWGRVGEVGSSSEVGPFQAANDASTAFKKKFREKTSNKWEDAQNGQFKAVTGKYELIETDESDPTAVAAVMTSGGISSSSLGPLKKTLPCKLDTTTKELVELIFSEDMFKSACTDMNIDVKKMPLGQLSKAQVQRGYDVLEELEDALKASRSNRTDRLEQLSARFYQVIPHSFGRHRPPVINTTEMLHSKIEMLNVLQDIGEAQSMLSSVDENGKAAEAVPHPTDVNYGLLNTDLKLLSPHSNEYGVIKQYLENTKSYGNIRMYDVWAVNREGEAQRFSAHDKIGNRKLLWHGTNVAVVAAIVKSGLRIMPHSGGRVGRGIYLASENAKSRGYVRPALGAKGPGINVGVMFLCEAALGKEHGITIDNSRLTSPPDGFDSVVARGRQEPDPSKDTTLTIDGKEVTVPQGKPKAMPAFGASGFYNSEYLVYQESQLRIRYMMTVKI